MKTLPLPKQDGSFSAELLRNPEALRTILDAADIPINYCSAERIFLFVNKTYAAWYGKTPEQIIGKSLVDLLGEKGVETIRPYYERALRGEHFRYETEVNLSIGYRYIQCNYTPVVDEKGVVTGWVGIIYDMTERYLLEKTLHENETALKLAKEKAEAASVAKSEFLANMSHELRTPMNAVVGLSHILSKSTPLTSKQKEFVTTLQLSAQSLLTLINDLLDFSKTESNRMDLEHIPYRFSSIVEEIISMFGVEAQKKNIVIDYVKSNHDDQIFLGDPFRIGQILTNLISNALKFTDKGRINIRLSTGPAIEAGHMYMHVSVKDTGIGIPENKISAVFDKFMQADMSITRKYGGSGLGLAISKNLAELMGGSITLESTLGEGSEFVLHLPVEYAEEGAVLPSTPRQEEIPSPMPSLSKPVNVLLAEDHSPNILVITTILEGIGYHYKIARTGKEVLAMLHEDRSHYDIVLMDIQMPEQDGYVTTSLVREEERKNGYKKMPIIGLSAHVMPDSIQACFDSGMDDYIAKPFDPDNLHKKISHLLQPDIS